MPAGDLCEMLAIAATDPANAGSVAAIACAAGKCLTHFPAAQARVTEMLQSFHC
jgi:hypothetical protein